MALARILSNAFGEILQCGDIDTIQIAAHVDVPLQISRTIWPEEKQAYQVVGWLTR
ncbi:hypothetical protein D3C71_1951590 [compost metagenome]